ncbi:unnamed protein product [Diplocarpon coronariae]|uniref:Uncharacterized protein n=1 Tax=Diplocarpon coronariae TaxID=2795749 RepID=A0A218ZJC3_9HELO|nr:hypothetical protein B2J93_3072 [Marssonina coronariae]
MQQNPINLRAPANCRSIFPPLLLPSPQPPMAQTMLLSKRLTAFLSQNTSPQLPTLLLLSPTGKLLSSSSPSPASTLRTQATLACSLWSLYQPTASLLPLALPEKPSSSSFSQRGSDETLSSTSTAADNELSTVTIQLTNGVMVIRALSCGLLFVAIGPSISTSASPTPPPNTLLAQAHLNSLSLSRHTSPPSSPPALADQEREPGPGTGNLGLLGVSSAAPSQSDSGSIRSTGTRTGSLVGVKRQAVEVGKWLDVQLEGFRLSSAER